MMAACAMAAREPMPPFVRLEPVVCRSSAQFASTRCAEVCHRKVGAGRSGREPAAPGGLGGNKGDRLGSGACDDLAIASVVFASSVSPLSTASEISSMRSREPPGMWFQFFRSVLLFVSAGFAFTVSFGSLAAGGEEFPTRDSLLVANLVDLRRSQVPSMDLLARMVCSRSSAWRRSATCRMVISCTRLSNAPRTRQ